VLNQGLEIGVLQELSKVEEREGVVTVIKGEHCKDGR